MAQDRLKALLISDFNLSNLAGYLNNDREAPVVQAFTAPYGQVTPVLLDSRHEFWKSGVDFAVIWSRPHGVIQSLVDLMLTGRVDQSEMKTQVDSFADALIGIQDRVAFALIPSWTIPADYAVGEVLDLKPDCGVGNAVMSMNLRLAERLGGAPNLHMLNSERWMCDAGSSPFNPKLWYMAKIPFANQVWQSAVRDIKAAINGVTGMSRKLIVIDLDDTIWGGIVGDTGWEMLNLGGHDPIGEAFFDFQLALKALKNRGILLAIVSKNEESIALEAIEKHPEMVLKPADFCGWRINWNDKAANIADLVTELNIGLQSVVFLDDSPIERARVRDALPEVLVPDLPDDKMLYRTSLMSLRCFDKPSISTEDIGRTEMYRTERTRVNLRGMAGSLDQWLRELNIRLTIEELNDANLARTAQLLNKTNQMNLSTRRMTETELIGWLETDRRRLWTVRVADKFGDSGLTGIVSYEELNSTTARIVDFVLSCRVMGRKVEEAMLHTVIQYAKKNGIGELCAEYRPTPRNMPCLRFLEASGFERNEGGNLFRWDLSADYPLPDCVAVEPYQPSETGEHENELA